MLEVIAKIKEAEQAAEDRKKDARRHGRQVVSEAHARGEELLIETKAKALRESADELSSAEANVEEELVRKRKECEAECVVLLSTAQKRLPGAVNVIVERIVNAP